MSIDRQAFNRSANDHIKSVSITKPINPESYSVNIIHHPANSFGLIGGLIAAAELSAKASGVTDAIKAGGFDVGALLSEAIKADLEKDGRFSVSIIEGPTRKPHVFIEDYKALEKASDAILDIYIGLIGYWANSHSSPYYPTLSVGARLVDLRSKAIIYNALFIYGPANIIPAGATRITPQPEFAKSTYDALLAHPEELTGGLKYAISKVADGIAVDLR